MKLTEEQQAILNGSEGAEMAKIWKTLVMYGDAFGAEHMVQVTSLHGHLVTSFGLSMMKGVFSLMDELITSGVTAKQSFTVDPRPMDPKVPANLLQKAVFQFMYGTQKKYEDQLEKIGLMRKDAFTCACYFPEVGNTPKMGDILSWAESSAVVYANSVLGARCNRNSGIIEMFGSIAGYVPEFGLLTDEGRKAGWIIEVKTSKKPEAQLLGSAIGMKVLEKVPYIKGLDQWLGTELNDQAKDYLKDMGAATASNGAVGLYHVEHLTPEAVDQGEYLIKENAPVYIIDDAELERVKNEYPVIWKNKNVQAKLAFIGCPHASLSQCHEWTARFREALLARKQPKIKIPTVLTTAPAVAEEFKKTQDYTALTEMGIILSSICPLMYMNNPLCASMPVITCSNKLRTYSTARYYTEDEIVEYIVKGDLS